MTTDQMLDEAFRLQEKEGNFAEAVKLWEKLSSLPSLDVEHQCLFLLNERKCRSALGQHKSAAKLLDKVENIDITHQFRMQVEFARIDDLYQQQKFAEGSKRSKKFADENASLLSSPEFSLLAYEQKLALSRGLVNANEFAEGLQLLSEILPRAEEQDKRNIHYYRGCAYQHLHQQESAIVEFKQVLSSNDHDSWAGAAYYNLAKIYASKGALAWAKQYLQNAETLKDFLTFPVNDIYVSLANVCASLHEVEEATRYKKLAESNPAT